MADLIPKVELPRYFTITSEAQAKRQIVLSIEAELVKGDPYTKSVTFDESRLTLNDLVKIFPFDQNEIGGIARMFMRTVALPRDFELAAKRGKTENQIDLSFELRGANHKRWDRTIDTSHLNLTDLAPLLEWAQEASKISRHG